MAKRSRDATSALQAAQLVKQENPTKPPPPKRCRDPSVGGGTSGNVRGPVEKGRLETDADRRAGGCLPLQEAPVEAPVARAEWDDEPAKAAAELPRWWQLWVGRGGGMVVDCEELLWGWFPFVDEDFCSDAEKVEWFSIWEDGVGGTAGGRPLR